MYHLTPSTPPKARAKRQAFYNAHGGAGENAPIARVVAQLTMFNDGLDAIKDGIRAADLNYAQPQSLADNTISQLEKIISGLRAVPVEVDINLIADQGDGIEDMEKPAKKKPPIKINPELRQNPKDE